MSNKVTSFFKNGFSAVKITNIDDLKNMYYGDVPLVYVFWIFGGLILGGFDVIHRILSYGIDSVSNQNFSDVLLLLDYLLLSVYIPLAILNPIAVWRSANKYKGRKIWPRMTKLFIGLSCVLLFLVLLVNIFAKSYMEELEKQSALANKENVAWVDNVASGSELVSS